MLPGGNQSLDTGSASAIVEHSQIQPRSPVAPSLRLGEPAAWCRAVEALEHQMAAGPAHEPEPQLSTGWPRAKFPHLQAEGRTHRDTQPEASPAQDSDGLRTEAKSKAGRSLWAG